MAAFCRFTATDQKSDRVCCPLTRVCSHYSKRFDDQREAEERQEEDIEFFKE